MGVGLENFLTLLSQTKTTNHNRNIQSNYILLLNLATKEELQDPNQDNPRHHLVIIISCTLRIGV